MILYNFVVELKIFAALFIFSPDILFRLRYINNFMKIVIEIVFAKLIIRLKKRKRRK